MVVRFWENDIVDIASEDGYLLCEVAGNVFDDVELMEVE